MIFDYKILRACIEERQEVIIHIGYLFEHGYWKKFRPGNYICLSIDDLQSTITFRNKDNPYEGLHLSKKIMKGGQFKIEIIQQ